MWFNVGYPIPIPGAAFLDLLFLLFSFIRKYMMPLPNFVFTADYQNRSVGPTLFPEMRLSLQSVAMWIYAKSCV